jgi:hypothetical protein
LGLVFAVREHQDGLLFADEMGQGALEVDHSNNARRSRGCGVRAIPGGGNPWYVCRAGRRGREARIRLRFAFLFADLATIEMEERIEVPRAANPEYDKQPGFVNHCRQALKAP